MSGQWQQQLQPGTSRDGLDTTDTSPTRSCGHTSRVFGLNAERPGRLTDVPPIIRFLSFRFLMLQPDTAIGANVEFTCGSTTMRGIFANTNGAILSQVLSADHSCRAPGLA